MCDLVTTFCKHFSSMAHHDPHFINNTVVLFLHYVAYGTIPDYKSDLPLMIAHIAVSHMTRLNEQTSACLQDSKFCVFIASERTSGAIYLLVPTCRIDKYPPSQQEIENTGNRQPTPRSRPNQYCVNQSSGANQSYAI